MIEGLELISNANKAFKKLEKNWIRLMGNNFDRLEHSMEQANLLFFKTY